MEVLAARAEVEDGVADELAGAVVGGLAAAPGDDERVREGGGVAQAGVVGGAADGIDGVVLEEEEGVGRGGVGEFAGDEVVLEGERLGVGEAAEPAGVEHWAEVGAGEAGPAYMFSSPPQRCSLVQRSS